MSMIETKDDKLQQERLINGILRKSSFTSKNTQSHFLF